MNVLSLFDGISCGQLALQRAGIPYTSYYASEIDKDAIALTQRHFPNTVQLGDVTNWRSWNLPKIDLLLGGSPCQGFSFAGSQRMFEDPRSKLIQQFFEVYYALHPRYVLLENVRMQLTAQETISQVMGIAPVLLDSAFVSGQRRKRLYWTNIPFTYPTEDAFGSFASILQTPQEEPAWIDWTRMDRVMHVDVTRGRITRTEYNDRLVFDDGESVRFALSKTNTVLPEFDTHVAFMHALPKTQNGRVYNVSGKIPTLTLFTNRPVFTHQGRTRALCLEEEELLQGLPMGYTASTNTYRGRLHAIGNAWNVPTIVELIKELSHGF